MDFEYLENSLLGSTGKRPDSGDIDIAIDSEVFKHQQFLEICKHFRENTHFETKTNGDTFHILFPIANSSKHVQMDLTFGVKDWMQFISHTPDSEESPFTGKFNTFALCIWAKSIILHHNGIYRVTYNINMQKGLHVKCWKRVEGKNKEKFTAVSDVFFEMNSPTLFHVPKLGYINYPPDVIRMLFGNTEFKKIDTFEKMILTIRKQCYKNVDRFEEFADNLLFAMQKKFTDIEMEEVRKVINDCL